MDKTYWQTYYASHRLNAKPSLFAHYVLERYLGIIESSTESSMQKSSAQTAKTQELLKKPQDFMTTTPQSPAPKAPKSLLELGCGNGRDALYFAKHGIAVIAIDQVQEEIAFLQEQARALCAHDTMDSINSMPTQNSAHLDCTDSIESTQADAMPRASRNVIPPVFIAGDFTQLDATFKQNLAATQAHATNAPEESSAPSFDCIYSRFTLHSITKAQQDRLLQDSLRFCKVGGILAIEVRGQKNELYKKGAPVADEPDAFIYDNHYRRFLHFEDTIAQLEGLRIQEQSLDSIARQGAPLPKNKLSDKKAGIESSQIIESISGGGATLMSKISTSKRTPAIFMALRFYTRASKGVLRPIKTRIITSLGLSQKKYRANAAHLAYFTQFTPFAHRTFTHHAALTFTAQTSKRQAP
ncbi:class I SAM-dependent methyltransferase [Helicobacter jaachi]|uniref:class I SAM-dependent methyltransferase n=1 Tax=Helicobacter jaachi TaxID=1677920 RepID=UPI00068CC34A|nr:class I SAM-dependent methyltransferase [Helicobacter jaachi]